MEGGTIRDSRHLLGIMWREALFRDNVNGRRYLGIM